MPDSTISGLPSASALSGTEMVPIVQNGNTVKATTQQIFNGATPVASTVVYTPPGSGAVATTVGAQLASGFVTPQNFGAVGDGVTDDTAAFQKLAAACQATVGLTVWSPPGKNYLCLSTGGIVSTAWIDLTGCGGCVWEGNGSTITLGNVNAGPQYWFYIKSAKNVCFRNWNLISGYAVLDQSNGIHWFHANYGSTNIVLENISMTWGSIGFTAVGIYQGQGVDTARVSRIRLNNIYMFGVYYGINCSSAGDNLFARGIVARNCGRTYFPYNCWNHDVEIDSVHGGPFSDVLIKCYGSTLFYSKTENIKLKYITTGRYPGSGLQNADDCMVNLEVQLNATNPAPCTMRNIEITFDVAATSADKNQGILFFSKWNAAGSLDSATGTGHVISGLDIKGIADASITNIVSDAINLFNISPNNWTGDTIQAVHIHDCVLPSSPHNGINIDCRGLSASSWCRIERVTSTGNLAASNAASANLSIADSILNGTPYGWNTYFETAYYSAFANPRFYIVNNSGTISQLGLGADSASVWIGGFNATDGFSIYAGGTPRVNWTAAGNATFSSASGVPITITGSGAGNAGLTINTSGTTGAQIATFAANNKPGSGTTAPSKWLPIIMDGTTYYIPAWQ